MSLTIEKLSEQLRRKIAGGDISKDFFITDLEMQQIIVEKIAQVLNMQLIEGIKYDDDRAVNPHFIGTYQANVAFDGTNNYYYADLPETFVQMVGKRGIQSIIPQGASWEDALIPMSTGLSTLISGTPAGNLEGDVGYYPQGNRIILYTPNGRKVPKTLVMQMVTPSTTDVDPATAGMVSDMIWEQYREKVMEDNLNDENSDRV